MVTMARFSAGKTSGYYSGIFCATEVAQEPLDSTDCEDVYEVERLVESKTRRGKTYYLVLWKGFPKEESFWVLSSDVTEFAKRMYENPCPGNRITMDSVSDLVAEIHKSLSKGLLKNNSFSLPFQRHVFNYLFQQRGKKVKNKPGRLYERSDFSSQYFSDDNFSYFNKEGEGCFVLFPIYMYSFVQFSHPHYDSAKNLCKRNFTETLRIKLVKSRS
ncbi:PREDICTED: uncharacterized protein LOC109589178 [Amphimedon queenslandica]|uniref:Chromo domain-containing protein n=1 Tax=Amphimedon queenslandica TaxID=400682 RepID=A0A1X7T994_AMPQE|nr:PREDICTED: uncharacterized protein LOC109589178 [Amphimedon queenslandica]|eukprot:XP_019860861.1 PREDICTED: uncharacterized protein LOC109589178 [Amphimedon queenslandica]